MEENIKFDPVEFEKIAARMSTEDLKRRIDNEKFCIPSAKNVVKWLKLGMTPRGPLELKKWEKRLDEIDSRIIVLKIVLLKRGERYDD